MEIIERLEFKQLRDCPRENGNHLVKWAASLALALLCSGCATVRQDLCPIHLIPREKSTVYHWPQGSLEMIGSLDREIDGTLGYAWDEHTAGRFVSGERTFWVCPKCPRADQLNF